ncbi:hypothetical protein PBN151_0211 [Paenibacillus sp. NAIST15-1]|nr:hypothetical protein PBN151_0211 [Paenibacillus sp. NAIST15-1]
MEYIIVAFLLTIAFITIILIKPNKLYNRIIEFIIISIVKTIQNKEPEIVCTIYNRLPPFFKERTNSKIVAEIVSLTIQLSGELYVTKRNK